MKQFGEWYNYQNQLAAARSSQVSQAAAQNKIYQTLQECSDISISGYNYRSSVQDRIFHQQHEYMMGVNTFYDPANQDYVEYNNLYDYMWTDGEYYLPANDPTSCPQELFNSQPELLEPVNEKQINTI